MEGTKYLQTLLYHFPTETEDPDLMYDFDLKCSPNTQFHFLTACPVSLSSFLYIYYLLRQQETMAQP